MVVGDQVRDKITGKVVFIAGKIYCDQYQDRYEQIEISYVTEKGLEVYSRRKFWEVEEVE